METWKTILGNNGYEISDYGSVRAKERQGWET